MNQKIDTLKGELDERFGVSDQKLDQRLADSPTIYVTMPSKTIVVLVAPWLERGPSDREGPLGSRGARP